jgi:hypothetical protein
MRDFPHFAIRKELWTAAGGMDERLYGYGYQFPELFSRMGRLPGWKPAVRFDLIAFHQAHFGHFGPGHMTAEKQKEVDDGKARLESIFPTEEALKAFHAAIPQQPLRPRRAEEAYKLRKGVLKKYTRRGRRFLHRLGLRDSPM